VPTPDTQLGRGIPTMVNPISVACHFTRTFLFSALFREPGSELREGCIGGKESVRLFRGDDFTSWFVRLLKAVEASKTE